MYKILIKLYYEGTSSQWKSVSQCRRSGWRRQFAIGEIWRFELFQPFLKLSRWASTQVLTASAIAIVFMPILAYYFFIRYKWTKLSALRLIVLFYIDIWNFEFFGCSCKNFPTRFDSKNDKCLQILNFLTLIERDVTLAPCALSFAPPTICAVSFTWAPCQIRRKHVVFDQWICDIKVQFSELSLDFYFLELFTLSKPSYSLDFY